MKPTGTRLGDVCLLGWCRALSIGIFVFGPYTTQAQVKAYQLEGMTDMGLDAAPHCTTQLLPGTHYGIY